jgi:hypothetical protein
LDGILQVKRNETGFECILIAVLLAYSVFQAALIHVYNCTSSNPAIAKEAKQYVTICTDECLAPLSKDIPAGPPLIPFLQTLSSLLRNDEKKPHETSSEPQSFTEAQSQQQPTQQQSFYSSIPSEQRHLNVQQTIPQGNNAFIDDLNRIPTSDSNQSWLLNGNGPGGAPALSQAAWQQLFSTAGTPFTENSNRGFDVQGNSDCRAF